ncbi:DUF6900 domain-containing protein [Candidatus Nitrotoga fabula]|uniref:DUF6900 domain-containing protein n=1 Tax=Candidatus Nitrotoga fabula TaxID=2182327 RepID=A0A916FAD2_9PROT|nr:hypothetical protein [Candidatus Nitrotoga fabula]CAE6714911.1 conserved hypothetical protein [Candidatus Nitrotoga fabula]
MNQTRQTTDQIIEMIAKKHFDIQTLDTRYSDRLDFHDVAVWEVKAALQAAFEAGRQVAREGEAS